MALFNYKIRDQYGKRGTGVVEARTDRDAANLLREQGFLVINIVPATGKFSFSALTNNLKGVGFNDIVNFTRQLATMFVAGLTLTDALNILRGQKMNPAFTRVLDDVQHEVEAGNNFANALEKYPRYFSRSYVALIRAGEAGGMLDQVLTRLADNLEKEKEFQSKVKGAMIYPVIILIGMVIVMFLMMVLVVPRLTVMYKDFNVALPLTTRILIAISDFSVSFWWLILLLGVLSIFLFNLWKKTSIGAHLLDKFLFSLPVMGKLRQEIILTEFCRTLGLLVSAGLPIIEALNIVSGSIESILYQEGLKEVALKVEKGFPMGVLFAQNPLYPAILGQMTKVGEETGKLDDSLLKLSHYFETESEQMVKGLTTAIEPIIMVVLAVGVGFMIFSIIMPIYQLTNAF
ncbi:MAG: type II secretion system F family protein [Patescibacteria group bacterium]|nr:type II secretion system F family protein [Patescibacteria group bacterium]MCL5095440.1 type II secretion system F family protein [Patescibacteria group bacterium]